MSNKLYTKLKKIFNKCKCSKYQYGDAIYSEELDRAFVKNRVSCMIDYIKDRSLLSNDKNTKFVLGVNGPWGVGKTSYINLLLKNILKDDELDIRPVTNMDCIKCEVKNNNQIIFLEPWNFRDKDSILNYFLKTIELKLIKSGVLNRDNDFSEYINLLSPNGYIKSVLHTINIFKKDLFLFIFLISFVLFISLYRLGHPLFLFYASYIPELIQNNIIYSIYIVSLVIIFLYLYVEYRLSEYKNLDSIKSNISEALLKGNKKFIIVIDDIDRLSKSEIIQVFSAVKQILDFPNIFFILAYDKKHVAVQIKEEFSYQNEMSAHLFMHKIVNIYEDLEFDTCDYLVESLKEKLFDSKIDKQVPDFLSNEFKKERDRIKILYESYSEEDEDIYRTMLSSINDLTFRDINQITDKLYFLFKNGWFYYDLNKLFLLIVLEHKYPEVYDCIKPCFEMRTRFSYKVSASEYISQNNIRENIAVPLKFKIYEESGLLKKYPHLKNIINIFINEEKICGNDDIYTEQDLYNVNINYYFNKDINSKNNTVKPFIELMDAYKNKAYDNVAKLLENYKMIDSLAYGDDKFNDRSNGIFNSDIKLELVKEIIKKSPEIVRLSSPLFTSNYMKDFFSSDDNITLTSLGSLSICYRDNRDKEEESERAFEYLQKHILNNLDILKKYDFKLDNSLSNIISYFYLMHLGFSINRGVYLVGEKDRECIISEFKNKNPDIADYYEEIKDLVFAMCGFSHDYMSEEKFKDIKNILRASNNKSYKLLLEDILQIKARIT